MIYLDPAWLREEYLTWHRSLDDIAAQVGCPIQTLNRFARDHGIPVRTRGTSIYMPASSAPRPPPARPARTAPQRPHRAPRPGAPGPPAVHRRAPQHPPAAQALGLWQSTLYDQVARLERACGGPLVNRSPRPPGTGILTPLGEQLCQQARDYLGLSANTPFCY